MSKRLYDNCEIYSQENSFIGYCPKKRMEWYITKGLATIINEKAIIIHFQPRMRYGNTKEDMITRKENICVVCKTTINLKKFHTIPQEFKKKFPLSYKEHVSNDIVLLCDEHLYEAYELNKSFKNDLYEAYNISDNDFIDNYKRKLISIALQIIQGNKSKKVIQEMINKDEISDEEINEIAKQDYIIYKDGCKSASEYIVKKYIDKNKLDIFITMWKENFIKNMEPKYLSKSYSKNPTLNTS